MFGPSYFGATYYGPTYFGPTGGEIVASTGTGLRGGGGRPLNYFVGLQKARLIKRVKEELAEHRGLEVDEIKGVISEGTIQVEAVPRETIQAITETIINEWDYEDGYDEMLEIQLRLFIEAYIQELLDEEMMVITMMYLM